MKEVQSEKELESVLNSPEKIVIFYFWNACPHCQAMHRPYDELEKDHKDVKFVKVESKNIPDKLGKSSFPEFELREKKKVKKSVGGEMSKEELNAKLFGRNLGGRRRRTRTRRLVRRVGKRSY
jgi:thiol-disulfide isomerase/thioredoxin